jgi:hypothetical protein
MRTLLLSALFLTATLAPASTLFTTFGPGDAHQLSGSTIDGPSDQQIGNWIQLTSGGVLTSIDLAMNHGSGQNLYRIDFLQDLGGASFFQAQFSVAPSGLTSILVAGGPLFNGDEQFWVTVRGIGQDTQGAWWGNSIGQQGTAAWRPAATQSDWNVQGDAYLNAIRLNSGGEQPAEAPEPSTLLLGGLGLAAVGCLRRKTGRDVH